MTDVPQQSYPGTSGQREKVASEIETVGWAILQALHEGVEDGPQSWSDMASDQEKRIKKAAIAAIEAVTDLAQFNAQGFSWPPQPLAPAQQPADRGALLAAQSALNNPLNMGLRERAFHEINRALVATSAQAKPEPTEAQIIEGAKAIRRERGLFGDPTPSSIAAARACLTAALSSAQGSGDCGDEEQPDCTTAREHELYFALMGLASAIMARRREWDNWVQGGVKVAPIVRKALRLNGPVVTSTDRGGK